MTTTTTEMQATIAEPLRSRAATLVNALVDAAGDEDAVLDVLRPHHTSRDFEDLVLAALVLTFVESLERHPDQPTND